MHRTAALQRHFLIIPAAAIIITAAPQNIAPKAAVYAFLNALTICQNYYDQNYCCRDHNYCCRAAACTELLPCSGMKSLRSVYHTYCSRENSKLVKYFCHPRNNIIQIHTFIYILGFFFTSIMNKILPTFPCSA